MRRKHTQLWPVFIAMVIGAGIAVIYRELLKLPPKQVATTPAWHIEPWGTGVITSTPSHAQHQAFKTSDFLVISFTSDITKRECLGIIDPQIADIGDWAPGDKVKVGRLVRPKDNPPYAEPVLISLVIIDRIE